MRRAEIDPRHLSYLFSRFNFYQPLLINYYSPLLFVSIESLSLLRPLHFLLLLWHVFPQFRALENPFNLFFMHTMALHDECRLLFTVVLENLYSPKHARHIKLKRLHFFALFIQLILGSLIFNDSEHRFLCLFQFVIWKFLPEFLPDSHDHSARKFFGSTNTFEFIWNEFVDVFNFRVQNCHVNGVQVPILCIVDFFWSLNRFAESAYSSNELPVDYIVECGV